MTHVHYVSSSYCIGENYDSFKDFSLIFYKDSRIYRDVLCQRFSNTSTVNQLKTPLHERDITEDNPSSVLYFAVSSELCFFFWVRRKMRRNLSCGFDMEKTKCDLSVCLNFVGFSSILQYPLWSETYSSIIILNKLATFEKGELITAEKYFENLFNPMAVECLKS